jgi:glutathione S-transferase
LNRTGQKKPADLAASGLKSNSKRVGGDRFTIARCNMTVRFILVIAVIHQTDYTHEKAHRQGLRAFGSPTHPSLNGIFVIRMLHMFSKKFW